MLKVLKTTLHVITNLKLYFLTSLIVLSPCGVDILAIYIPVDNPEALISASSEFGFNDITCCPNTSKT